MPFSIILSGKNLRKNPPPEGIFLPRIFDINNGNSINELLLLLLSSIFSIHDDDFLI